MGIFYAHAHWCEFWQMTWGNYPPFNPKNAKPKQGKKITPEMLAASGSEDGEQMALFAWAADSVGKYPQLKWLFSIPNGGSRHIAEATKMVATGLRSGVPDVCLPATTPSFKHNFCMYFGCFIEMKVGKNKTSDKQAEWIAYLMSAGYYVAICYSWQEARDTLINYLEGKV